MLRSYNETMPVGIARRRGFVDRVDKPMNLHNNFADVGTWYLRTMPVSILNGSSKSASK